jgi:lambda repressor-like predicted transcriptional regulator
VLSTRRVKKGPGRRPLSAKRQRFLQLREQGWSIRGAAREAGVSRASGNRWSSGYKTYRHGVVAGFVPALDPRALRQVSARLLSQDERVEIADLRQAGLSIRRIAEQLARAPSTVSRELRRNAAQAGGTGRSRRTGARPRGGPAIIRGASRSARHSGNWLASCWPSGGARGRSAASCGSGFRTSRRCGCVTRASTRPSTGQDRR